MNKKYFSIILTLILLVGMVLSACAGGTSGGPVNNTTSDDTTNAATGDKVTVNFWTFWGSETRRPIIEKIVNDFNNSQDKIIVKHTFHPWGDIWTKNLASIAAGNPADVIINDINTVAQRAQNKQATDLSKYLNAEQMKNRFYPDLWNNVLHEGKPYALPFNTDTRLLFYNKKAFKDAGLDPEKPPQTWAELERYAKKLDKKQGNMYQQVGFYPLWGDFGANNWMLNADGGQAFLDKDGKPIVNTPSKVEALHWINQWTKRIGENNVNAMKAEFGSEQANPFISGKVAMWVDTATFYTQIRDYGNGMDFGVVPIPEKDSGTGHWSWGGGFVAEIPYGAKHPKEAAAFIDYLTDVDAQSYWAEKNFDIVANKEAAENVGSGLKDNDQNVYQAATDNMKNTVHTPVPLSAPDYVSLIDPEVEAALLGKQSPEKALEKAQKAVEKLIKSNQ